MDFLLSSGLSNVEATLSVFSQVVKAVEYCHSNGIAHNDIKLENVLSNGCVKLADFGFAKSSVAESEEFCGTLPYAAPEVIMGMEHNTMKADMWSMGVMLYVMLFGAFPFSDSDATSMVKAQISNTLSFPENTSDILKSLVSSMLEPSVEKRADAISVHLALSQF
ncbi:TSSK [Mytilus coruscus]|uniref:TSSK n=1 Tax=Mytilus coruscus TaxID=42192 RepID=A0A6J8DF47_MYTCO|nr:TSSK [Mytilus coruscus]